MFAKAQALLDQLSQLFQRGDMARMARNFAFPQPVQVVDAVLLFHTPEELAAGLRAYQNAKCSHGLGGPTPKVVATDIPRKGRYRIWADWTYSKDGNPAVATSQAIYYCRDVDGQVQIEMVQYTAAVMGDLRNYSPERRHIA